MKKLNNFLGIKDNYHWAIKLTLSLIIPFLLLIIRPLNFDLHQSIILATLVLSVTWWSTNTINKIPTSIFMLLIFIILKAAPIKELLSFPLSNTFFLIVITYLFSSGIANLELVEKIFGPKLLKWCKTPVKVLIVTILLYILTIYIIPQPLARLIIVTNLLYTFLKKTNVAENTRRVLMYGAFVFYSIVNMMAKNADIIMNNAAVAFAGTSISDGQWIRYMAVPTVVYGIIIFIIFVLIFRKDLLHIHIEGLEINEEKESVQLNNKDKTTLIIVVFAVLLWMTGDIHNISPVWVTALATILMFFIKTLTVKDLKKIDITTLVFLTAAFSIGTAIKGCGVADVLFSSIKFIFPDSLGIYYILTMVLVAMTMHMILGSNTTTLSVVIPGLIIIGKNIVSDDLVVYITVVAVSFHAILPFHSVALMIGESRQYFPTSYVTKLGLVTTIIVFLGAILIYYPWWTLLGIK